MLVVSGAVFFLCVCETMVQPSNKERSGNLFAELEEDTQKNKKKEHHF